jgi:hypothetical protein
MQILYNPSLKTPCGTLGKNEIYLVLCSLLYLFNVYPLYGLFFQSQEYKR